MPPKKRILVPYRPQPNTYFCGPASMQMVFEFFHRKTRQRKLARAMHTNSQIGSLRQSMIRAATRAGFYCYVNNNASLKELKRYIAEGFPVIVRFLAEDDDKDHYSVVCGYTPRSITIHDPYNGKNHAISIPRFLARWHDEDGSHAGWMMVLSKDDFRFGKLYRPAGVRTKRRQVRADYALTNK